MKIHLALSRQDGAVEIVCPRCGKGGQRPIVYGLPTGEGGERAERGEVVLGGCFVMPADTACPACGLEWESRRSLWSNEEGK